MGADIPTTRAAYPPLICPVVPNSTAAPAPIKLCTTAAAVSTAGSKYAWNCGASPRSVAVAVNCLWARRSFCQESNRLYRSSAPRSKPPAAPKRINVGTSTVSPGYRRRHLVVILLPQKGA